MNVSTVALAESHRETGLRLQLRTAHEGENTGRDARRKGAVTLRGDPEANLPEVSLLSKTNCYSPLSDAPSPRGASNSQHECLIATHPTGLPRPSSHCLFSCVMEKTPRAHHPGPSPTFLPPGLDPQPHSSLPSSSCVRDLGASPPLFCSPVPSVSS